MPGLYYNSFTDSQLIPRQLSLLSHDVAFADVVQFGEVLLKVRVSVVLVDPRRFRTLAPRRHVAVSLDLRQEVKIRRPGQIPKGGFLRKGRISAQSGNPGS